MERGRPLIFILKESATGGSLLQVGVSFPFTSPLVISKITTQRIQRVLNVNQCPEVVPFLTSAPGY
jgi:hypothetical protein